MKEMLTMISSIEINLLNSQTTVQCVFGSDKVEKLVSFVDSDRNYLTAFTHKNNKESQV